MANVATPAGNGLVTGQFLIATNDTADVDDRPDAVPATGIITFTPSVSYVRVANIAGMPNAQTILLDTVVGVLDASGYLCRNFVDPVSGTYVRGVPLLATDDTDMSPSGWTWKVSYALKYNGGNIAGPMPHPLQISTSETKDLSTAAPVTESGGVITIKGPKGDPGPANLIVGPVNTLTIPGLWVQTGLGDGTDFTIWIEDGQ